MIITRSLAEMENLKPHISSKTKHSTNIKAYPRKECFLPRKSIPKTTFKKTDQNINLTNPITSSSTKHSSLININSCVPPVSTDPFTTHNHSNLFRKRKTTSNSPYLN